MFRPIRTTIIMGGLCLSPLLATAYAQDVETLTFEGQTWQIAHTDAGDVRTGEYMGRDALYIRRGQARLNDLDLADMVIDYSYVPTEQSGFMGVNFRDLGNNNLEQFYTRPHQSGQPDATQYQPVINGRTAWQLYAGPNDATAIDITADTWSHVRIVAIGDAADIYIDDMDTPAMHVPDLRIDAAHGTFSLFMSDRPWMPDTGVWFSNVTVRAATDADRLIGEAVEEPALPVGVIGQWSVSSAFAESTLDGQFTLPEQDLSWSELEPERNGVANLARVTAMEPGQNTVLASLSINSDDTTIREMSFGYSDRVRVYLNGQQIYAGNAQWRARDHRHLGTIAYVDKLPLQLSAGDNTLVFAVSESFGGWGVAAAIEDQDGLTIRP
jgi:hypothetical protein